MPAFGEVALQLRQRTYSQPSPQLPSMPLFSSQNMPQRLNFILHLRKAQGSLYITIAKEYCLKKDIPYISRLLQCYKVFLFHLHLFLLYIYYITQALGVKVSAVAV